MTREDMVAMVQRIIDNDGTEEEIDALVVKIDDALPHSWFIDMLRWKDGWSAEQLVDDALRREETWREGRYEPLIPETLNQVVDVLGEIYYEAPRFEHEFIAEISIDHEFLKLNEGLRRIRKDIGELKLQLLLTLSDQIRAHFEADPHDSNGRAQEGRNVLRKMEQILLDAE